MYFWSARNAVNGYIWRDELLPLDIDTANAALRYLRTAGGKTPPTVPEFAAAYRSLRPRPEQHETRPAWTTVRNPISRSEYLARLEAKADAGDELARDELTTWERYA